MIDETALVVQILSAAMPTVEVTTEMVDTSLSAMGHGRYVIVSHIGDESDMFIQVPTMEMLCCAETDAIAGSLARSCAEALQEAALDHPYLSETQIVDMGRDSYTNSRNGRHRLSMRLFINQE